MPITGIMSALQIVSAEVDEACQVSTLLTFLFIAQRGTCTQKDVEVFMKTTNASCSRNVSYWTERRFDRNHGMGFVTRTADDYDRRMRNLTLTPRGKAFYAKLKGLGT
jgi:DNA-binding MarR family transcriptional regulator